MSDDAPTDEDTGAPEATISLPMPKGRKSLSRLRRELTDEELQSPGVNKMMMDDLDRLENEKADLQPYIQKFYLADKEKAVLIERGKIKTASDVVFGAFMTIGAAAVGYSTSLPDLHLANSFVLWAGIILLGAGIVSKLVLK